MNLKNRINDKIAEVNKWIDANSTPLTYEEARRFIERQKASKLSKENKEKLIKAYNELHPKKQL